MTEATAASGISESNQDAGAGESAMHPEPGAPVERDVIVIGGGVAGLVAALENARLGLSVTVLEEGSAPGGCVARHTLAGIDLDSGAESFATRKNVVAEYLEGINLSHLIVQPNPAGSWLRLPSGGSIPMPRLSVLGIPASPLADEVRAAIGWKGAIRAYADRLMPVLKIGREENLGQLVKKRMGKAVLEALVAPIAGGVYSADPLQLSVEAVVPGLNAAITRTGSLSGAVAQIAASAPAGSRILGLEGGMSRLVDALVFELRKFGAEVVLNTKAEHIRRLTSGIAGETEDHSIWRIFAITESEDEGAAAALSLEPREFTSRGIIVAAPARESLRLLASVDPVVPAWIALRDRNWPDAPGVELVTLVVTAPELDMQPRGTGVLTSASDPSVTAKALTHVSAKWGWVSKAARSTGEGRHVLRLSYGRAGEANPISGLSDTEVQRIALADASTILGVDLREAQLASFARTRWDNALPVATIGANERIRAVREAVSGHEGIEVAGAWLAGTGLAQVIPDARDAGRRLRRSLLPSRER